MHLGDSGGWYAAALLLSALAPARAEPADRAAAHVDHVILGIGDLDEGMRAFARATGVAPARGGEHPGRGTANALASLGGGRYLEILAPAAPRPAAEQGKRPPPAAPGTGDLTRLATLAPVGWALGTSDLDGLIARLRAEGFQVVGPEPGSRRRPDGRLLEWRTAHLAEPGIALAPFFIEWSAAAPHPGATSPPGCELAAVELADPAPERLERLLRAAGLETRPVQAGERRMVFTLSCPRGRVAFDSHGR